MLVLCVTEDHKVHKIPEEPHPINLGQVEFHTMVAEPLTLFWGGILTSYSGGGGGGGKITSPILTAVLVVQLSSNLVRMSNCQSVLNFWKKNQNLL